MMSVYNNECDFGGKIFPTFLLITIFLRNFQYVSSAIINTRNPIVIFENVPRAHNIPEIEDDERHFGYSLAFVKNDIWNTQGKSTKTSINGGTLFIGAPNEKRAAMNSGVVWKCNFSDDTVECSTISEISNMNNFDTRCSFRKNSLRFPEDETHQRIGATLAVSQEIGKLFVCAPRLKINSWLDSSSRCTNTTALLGSCYVVSADGLDEVLNPFQPQTKLGIRYTINYSIGKILHPVFGLSSHITDTGEFFAGAPSARFRSGLLVSYQTENENASHVIRNPDTTTSSHFGYAITSGKTFGNLKYLAVTATTDHYHYGVVTVFDLSTQRVNKTYKGIHIGSNFGYALATVDLNGDGNDKLLVGAPTYTHDFSTGGKHTVGCVFIFDLSLPQNYPLEPSLCMGTRNSPRVSEGSRFGTAICNIGDINFDTKEDFAVGAPHDDDGVGTVFIYYGSYRISEVPAQIIQGKSLSIPNLRGFGTSIIGGKRVDIDGNGTPDMVLGAFLSGHVVVLRTRPVVRLTIRITFHKTENSKLAIFKLFPHELTFWMKICVSLEYSIKIPSNMRQDRSLNLNVWVNYEFDKNEKRVGFIDNQHASKHALSPFKEICFAKQLEIFNDISKNSIIDSIEFRVNLTYNETQISENQTSKNVNMKLTNFHNNSQTREYSAMYRNLKKWLPATFSESQETTLVIANDSCLSDGIPECDSNLQLNLSLFYELVDRNEAELWAGNPLLMGQLDTTLLSIIVRNTKETAFQPTIQLRFEISSNYHINRNSQLQFKWLDNFGKTGECKAIDDELIAQENYKNFTSVQLCSRPLHKGMEITYNFKISNLKYLTLGSKETTGNLVFKVEAFPYGRNDIKKKLLIIPIVGNLVIDVNSSAPSTGQSPIDPEKRSLISFTQFFVVTNLGYSSTGINTVKAEIFIPSYAYVEGGFKRQIIETSDPSDQSNDIRCTAVSGTFFDLSKSTNTAYFNETTNFDQLKIQKPLLISSDKYITMGGCNGDNKLSSGPCQKIECLVDLPSKSSKEIELRMYLSWKTIGDKVPYYVKGVRIQTFLKVFYLNEFAKEIVGSTQRNLILKKDVPAWIYLTSGAGGLVTLMSLVFIFSKCGFFKRNKMDELKKLRRQTMQNEEELDIFMFLQGDSNHD